MYKIAIYKTKRRNGHSATCKSFLSFVYKSSGSTSVTFKWKECNGIENTFTFILPPSVGFETMPVGDQYEGGICFEEGTLVRISGHIVTDLAYGTCGA